MTIPLPPLARAALLGAATGIRSQLPLALLARAVSRGELGGEGSPPPAWLQHPRTARLTALSAVGETIGDKLPFVPSRSSPGPLLGRVAFGGLVGWIAMRAEGEGALPGAAVGAAAGGLLAVAATKLRAAGVERTGLPDIAWGAGEDVVTLAVGLAALPSPRAVRS